MSEDKAEKLQARFALIKKEGLAKKSAGKFSAWSGRSLSPSSMAAKGGPPVAASLAFIELAFENQLDPNLGEGSINKSSAS